MDIHCIKCSEPLDHDELHYIDGMTYREASAAFRSGGCTAIGYTCNDVPSERRDPVFGLTAGEASSALYDLLGDDMDGAAAMLEDMGF